MKRYVVSHKNKPEAIMNIEVTIFNTLIALAFVGTVIVALLLLQDRKTTKISRAKDDAHFFSEKIWRKTHPHKTLRACSEKESTVIFVSYNGSESSTEIEFPRTHPDYKSILTFDLGDLIKFELQHRHVPAVSPTEVSAYLRIQRVMKASTFFPVE